MALHPSFAALWQNNRLPPLFFPRSRSALDLRRDAWQLGDVVAQRSHLLALLLRFGSDRPAAPHHSGVLKRAPVNVAPLR